jgi:hypothetical protein
MLGPDELERLSRSLAGELSPEEARALEQELRERPELREGLRQLEQLDRAVAELPEEALDPEVADRLVRGALGRESFRGGRWIGASALVAALVVVVAVAAPWRPGRDAAEVVAVSGSVWMGGADLGLSARALRPPAVVETGTDGAAIISLPRGTLRLPPRSRVQLTALDSAQLERGTVLASAQGVSVSGAVIHGDAVISAEPSPGLDRVTEAIWESGGDMARVQWTRLLPPAAAAVAVSGVTVFVLAGRAEPAGVGSAPVAVVKGGEQWRSGAASPAPLEVAARPSPLVTARPSVEAELARVRAERDALVKQRDALLASRGTTAPAPESRKPEDEEVTEVGNPYRVSKDTLRRRAERGEFVFHGPFFTSASDKPSIPDAAANELGLTADEQRQVLEAARTFGNRVHDRLVDLYASEGGDRRAAEPMASTDVLDLLRRLPGTDKGEDAVKQIARELGGVAPPLANPSPMLRGFRVMAEEESAYLDALDRILGPARAEALLNAGGLGRMTSSFSSH